MQQRIEWQAVPELYATQETMIPRLLPLRRVSRRYWQVLPLEVMKRYQCIVVGSSRNALTVAITDQKSSYIFGSISELTGRKIFPVLVQPSQLRLQLRRIERAEAAVQHRRHRLLPPSEESAYALDVHTLLLCLTHKR